jgi:hypothetical protein
MKKTNALYEEELKLIKEQRKLAIPMEGPTALYDGVLEGINQIRMAKHAKRALVVITDGRDTASSSSFTETLQVTEKTGVPIYSIGIITPSSPQGYSTVGPFSFSNGPLATAEDFRPLQTLSEKTKGAHFLLKTTDVNESARVFALALNRTTGAWHRDAHADRSRVVRPLKQSARSFCAQNNDSGDAPD